jgi:hypothetical protein
MGAKDYEIIKKILEANKGKDFVDRILNPDKYPVIDLGGGNYATHKMASGESDGKYHVFPTIIHKDGELIEYKGKEAYDHAMKTGEYIEFKDPAEAAWFGEMYKKYWDGPSKNGDE